MSESPRKHALASALEVFAKEPTPAREGSLTRALRVLAAAPSHQRSSIEIQTEIDRLEREIAKTQAERDALWSSRPPGPRNEWPGLAAALLIGKPPRTTPLANSGTRVQEAIRDGWIAASPSQELRDALAVLDREVLWTLLHLDARADSLLAWARRDLRRRTAEERLQTRRLAEFRRAVVDLPKLTAIRRGAGCEDVTAAIDVVEDALKLALDWAYLGRAMVTAHVADLEKKSRSHAAAEWRGRQLAWLLQALNATAGRGKKWSLLKLARLILSSGNDFVVPPCPSLVSEYQEGDESGEAESGEARLADMIKKRIAKAGKIRERSSSRIR